VDKYQSPESQAAQARFQTQNQSAFSRTRIEQYNNITNNRENFFKNDQKESSLSYETSTAQVFEYYKRNPPPDGDFKTLSKERAESLGIQYKHLYEVVNTWWPLL